MVNIIIAIISWAVGLFLWSNIIGSLFAALPFRLKLKKIGEVKSVQWHFILVPIVWSILAIIILSYFSTAFFIGSSIAGVMILFRIGELRKEEIEKYMSSQEYRDFRDKRTRDEDAAIRDMVEKENARRKSK